MSTERILGIHCFMKKLAVVVFMGVLKNNKILNKCKFKMEKYKIDIKRGNHINYNKLFQS